MLKAVRFTGSEGVTQQLADLMYTGMDAVFTPSIALWVSDCLLSYFHPLPSSTVLFSLHFQSEGNKASANLQLSSVLVLENDPTALPRAQTHTETCACAHKAKKATELNVCADENVHLMTQTADERTTPVTCQLPLDLWKDIKVQCWNDAFAVLTLEKRGLKNTSDSSQNT